MLVVPVGWADLDQNETRIGSPFAAGIDATTLSSHFSQP
jgi:hypothetical protein